MSSTRSSKRKSGKTDKSAARQSVNPDFSGMTVSEKDSNADQSSKSSSAGPEGSKTRNDSLAADSPVRSRGTRSASAEVSPIVKSGKKLLGDKKTSNQLDVVSAEKLTTGHEVVGRDDDSKCVAPTFFGNKKGDLSALTKEGRRVRARKKPVKDESESSDCDDHIEENLAVLPDFDPVAENAVKNCADRDECMWNAPAVFFDSAEKILEINAYLSYASSRSIFADRALHILMKSDYDLTLARKEVDLRRRVQDHWSDFDKEMFKKAVLVYGKKFHSIQKIMPHKCVASLVNYYYLHKSMVNFKSDEPLEEFDESDDESHMYRPGPCANCGEVKMLYFTDVQYLCIWCKRYLRLMMCHRPTKKSLEMVEPEFEREYLPPAGMEDICNNIEELLKPISMEEFEAAKREEQEKEAERKAAMAANNTASNESDDDIEIVGEVVGASARKKWCELTEPPPRYEARTRKAISDIAELKQSCFNIEQTIRELGASFFARENTVENCRRFLKKIGNERQRYSHKWTDQDRFMAFQGLIRYEADFAAVADIVPTKSADMIKAYYQTVKDKVDEMIRENYAQREAEAQLVDVTSLLNLKDFDEAS